MTEQAERQIISGRFERGDIDGGQYLEELMRFVSAQIGCTRAGLRLFVDTAEARALRCVAMYDAQAARMVPAADIVHLEGSAYLERLQRDGNVTVGHGLSDPLSNDSVKSYLRSCGLSSWMDVSFSVNGSLFGTFVCEQRGAPVEWSQRQLQMLRKIASRASLTLMQVVNASVDTAPGALWESSTPNRLVTMPMPLGLLAAPESGAPRVPSRD
jgi:hypothetical protein